MTEKRQIRLFNIKNFDIIGLDGTIFGNQHIFTVKCISQKGEGFKIEKKVAI